MEAEDCVFNTRVGQVLEGRSPHLYLGKIVGPLSTYKNETYAIIEWDGNPLNVAKVGIKLLLPEKEAICAYNALVDEATQLEKEFKIASKQFTKKLVQATELIRELNKDLDGKENTTGYYNLYSSIEWQNLEQELIDGGWLPSQSC